MKNRIVLWGTNDQDERVLIAMELKPHDNKVEIMTFPESLATEEFSRNMMDQWREGKPFDLPEGYQKMDRELTVAESILPDNLKVERGDIIIRAQTEWHFTVLSVKLHETYKSELLEIKEQVDKLSQFEAQTWDNLKTFWDKVQNQVRDRNLFREQADSLRDSANELFTRLKELRVRVDNDFKVKSRENFDRLQSMIEDVESRAAKGLRIQPLFDELRKMQQEFKELEFTREDRNKLWNRLDEAFKAIKGKRSGGGNTSGDDNPGERLRRRYEGLIGAIEKMRDSIRRDRQELDFQSKKVASTDGQLEAQIRQAKIKMVEERLHSKEEKLREMEETQTDLDRRLASIAERDARREKVEEAKREAEKKIKESVSAAAQAREDDTPKLEKAAEAIAKRKDKKGAQLFEAASTVLGEALMDALDSAKAVAEIAKDNLGNVIEDLKEEAAELGDKIKDKVLDIKEDLKELREDIKDEARELNEDIREEVAEARETVTEKLEQVKDALKAKIESIAPDVEVAPAGTLPQLPDPANSEEPNTGIENQDTPPAAPETFSDTSAENEK
jgi:chromosome segregation ATPase